MATLSLILLGVSVILFILAAIDVNRAQAIGLACLAGAFLARFWTSR